MKKKPGKDIIWTQIDFNKVKNRINEVTSQIERVIKKYKVPNESGISDKRKN
jgi:hypothetical protein